MRRRGRGGGTLNCGRRRTGPERTGGRRPTGPVSNDSPEAAMRSYRFLPLSRAEAPVLCLTATGRPGGANDLSGALLARLAESARDVGTVVLAPDGDIDTTCLQAVCALHERLRASGIQLRLVAGKQEQAQQLRASSVSETVTALPVHPS